jgi:predicted 3-demethylubiquinone-9 3-methyltransferase (glyoxalase superfamily)
MSFSPYDGPEVQYPSRETPSRRTRGRGACSRRHGGPQFKFDEAVSFQVNCETQADVDYYWERLSEGGKEGPCGWLKDRYGLSWQVVPTGMEELLNDPDPERARRAMQALLEMGKLDIAAMRSAADGVPAT